MKKLIISFSLFATQYLLAQQQNIVLHVLDQSSSKPVKMAAVSVNHQVVLTDSLGTASILEDQQGMLELKIECTGYKPYISKLNTASQTEIRVDLIPEFVDLGEVLVEAKKENSFGIRKLNDTEGTSINAGKKTEVIDMESVNSNLATNNSRQVYAKVAGINVLENDGAGTSVAIGGRGLNPGRVANFNTRQNGYDMSADPLGYPEAYYTTPLNALERIEVVKGASALQYGPQFGGMINYKMKEPEKKKLAGDFSQGIGSFGMFNSFNRLSGTANKLSYSAYYQYKTYTGWRDRSEVTNHDAYVSLSYALSPNVTIKADYTHMSYLAQQPGGLTEDQFKKDKTFVNRYRNWFQVNWNLMSLSLDYKLKNQDVFNIRSFGLIADRNSIGYTGTPDKADDTSAYRNLNKDKYRNYGAELRYLHAYELFSSQHQLLVGARYYKGKTLRSQGNGDKSANPNFNFLNPTNLENSDYTFPSSNYALFAENIFHIGSRYSFVPGLRYEYIDTRAEGYYRLINNSTGTDTKVYEQQASSRSFVIFGLGNQYTINKFIEAYANVSQNYKAVNFNDLRITSPTSKVDPNLKDERGYTADLGFRGKVNNILYYDISGFYMYYNNRIGSASVYDSVSKQTIKYRTNIGRSINQGIEAFAELDWMKLVAAQSRHKLSTYVNASYIQAVYYSDLSTLSKKEVEYSPDRIIRMGISYAFASFGCNLQASYTSQQYSDANNTEYTANGLTGKIPEYSVIDFSANYTYKKLSLVAGINNLANSTYFTRRAEGLPGPGIIPADPRNYYLNLRFRF